MPPYLLLVEDDEATAYLTLKALQKSVFPGEIVRMRDGQETLQHLLSEKPKPALILLDMKLPKVGGIEVLEKIRSTPDLMLLPVII